MAPCGSHKTGQPGEGKLLDPAGLPADTWGMREISVCTGFFIWKSQCSDGSSAVPSFCRRSPWGYFSAVFEEKKWRNGSLLFPWMSDACCRDHNLWIFGICPYKACFCIPVYGSGHAVYVAVSGSISGKQKLWSRRLPDGMGEQRKRDRTEREEKKGRVSGRSGSPAAFSR